MQSKYKIRVDVTNQYHTKGYILYNTYKDKIDAALGIQSYTSLIETGLEQQTTVRLDIIGQDVETTPSVLIIPFQVLSRSTISFHAVEFTEA